MAIQQTGIHEVPRGRAAPSLIRGGPFYQGQLVTRLIEADRWNLGRRILFMVCIAWVPLVLLTLLFKSSAILNLLLDYRVASRLLIAIPVLLLGQVVMDSRFKLIVNQVREDLLNRSDTSRMDSTITTLVRWRDSFLPELVIVALSIVLSIVHTAAIVHQRSASFAIWAFLGSSLPGSPRLTPAGWYYAIVSQVIYQFLVGLCLWKWLLWTFFLFKLSRMDLKLEASHPDRHGGIGFVGMSPLAFAPVALGITAAIAATWREQILHSGAHLMSFKTPAAVLLVLILTVAIGPLTFFMPKLTALRRQGILEYGSLAHLHSSEFYDKWILHRKGREREFLSAPEISSLIDLASSYQNIEAMTPLPVEKVSMVALLVAIVLPALPAVLAQIPLTVVLKDLLEAAR